MQRLTCTGKSLSEALIFASTSPQYGNRLFIELSTSSIHEKGGNYMRKYGTLNLQSSNNVQGH